MKPSLSLFLLIALVLFNCTKKQEHSVNSKNDTHVENKARQWQDKAEQQWNNKKYHSAYYYYDKAKSAYQTLNKNENTTYCLIKMASIQQFEGDYFGSESSLIEALPYVKQNKTYQAAINNLLGIASKEQKNYDSAIHYYKKTYTLAENKLTQIVSLNNIANVYIQQGKFQKAQLLLNNILKEKLLDTLPLRKAIYLDNYGYCLFKTNQKEKALKTLKQALYIKNKNKDTYECIESYLHLADVHIKINPNKSFDYASKAYQYATLHKSIDQRLEALLLMIKTPFSNQKILLKYAQLNDSITQVRNKAKNQFAKIKYDARLAKEENLKLKNKQIQIALELQKSENEKDFWLIIAVLLISFVLFLTNYFKNKNQREKQKTTYLTETRIAKKIHDELANDVFQTISFVETKTVDEPQNKEELINLLDTIYQRSRNISKENESIQTGELFFENLLNMINSYKTENRNIIIKKDDTIKWESFSEINKITLFRVLQELLVNMKKHSGANLVLIAFLNTTKNIQIDYTDNGTGFDLNRIKKNGLVNVENRIHNINGNITFDETHKGVKIKINIPK